MSSLLKLEFFKLIKRWPICLVLFLIAFFLPLFSNVRTINHFIDSYSFWARISKDLNPYNFIINKISWNVSVCTLICLAFWALVITSLEYKENTLLRLSITKIGFIKIIYAKTIMLILFGSISLSISILSSYITYKNIVQQFPKLFIYYSFWETKDLFIFFGLLFMCIAKVSLFHHVVMSLSKKLYYIPLAICILSPFLFVFNLLPYGFYYKTFNGSSLMRTLVVYNNLIGFTWVILFYFIFYSISFQNQLKKYLPL